ncbi:MAG: hypothetical protein Q4G26_07160 [Paracoccus sp. (in: a-proteobacteria)]|nr:hypothetical protein [Paracoccus sp. (in: a-proteobacteria)]
MRDCFALDGGRYHSLWDKFVMEAPQPRMLSGQLSGRHCSLEGMREGWKRSLPLVWKDESLFRGAVLAAAEASENELCEGARQGFLGHPDRTDPEPGPRVEKADNAGTCLPAARDKRPHQSVI